MTTYTVGMRVPNTTNPHLHMTLCYLGELNDQEIQTIKSDLDHLSALVVPLHIEFGERDLFGPNNDIPVRLVKITDKDKKSLLDQFYRKYHKAEVGIPEGDSQNFHITIKTIIHEADSLNEMILSEVFMKPVGPCDPIWKNKDNHTR